MTACSACSSGFSARECGCDAAGRRSAERAAAARATGSLTSGREKEGRGRREISKISGGIPPEARESGEEATSASMTLVNSGRTLCDFV